MIDRRAIFRERKHLVRLAAAALVLAALLALVAVLVRQTLDNRGRSRDVGEGASMIAPIRARASLQPLAGSRVSGTLLFLPREEGGLDIRYRFSRLPPGRHVLSLHETGRCTTTTGSSVVGSLVASSYGVAEGSLIGHRLTLDRGRFRVIGRSVAIDTPLGQAAERSDAGAVRSQACGIVRPS